MKATVHIPSGMRRAGQQAESTCITVTLPFMPHPGMSLRLLPDGCYQRVEDVFWDIATPDEVEVFLEFPMHLHSHPGGAR